MDKPELSDIMQRLESYRNSLHLLEEEKKGLENKYKDTLRKFSDESQEFLTNLSGIKWTVENDLLEDIVEELDRTTGGEELVSRITDELFSYLEEFTKEINPDCPYLKASLMLFDYEYGGWSIAGGIYTSYIYEDGFNLHPETLAIILQKEDGKYLAGQALGRALEHGEADDYLRVVVQAGIDPVEALQTHFADEEKQNDSQYYCSKKEAYKKQLQQQKLDAYMFLHEHGFPIQFKDWKIDYKHLEEEDFEDLFEFYFEEDIGDDEILDLLLESDEFYGWITTAIERKRVTVIRAMGKRLCETGLPENDYYGFPMTNGLQLIYWARNNCRPHTYEEHEQNLANDKRGQILEDLLDRGRLQPVLERAKRYGEAIKDKLGVDLPDKAMFRPFSGVYAEIRQAVGRESP